MANVSFSKDQLAYFQLETTFGQAPNSSGASTVANSNACRIISFQPDASQDLIDRPDKTGSLDFTLASPGKRKANWSASMSLAGSGVAGTAPDCGPLLQCAFGKAPTVSAGVSVTYNLDDLSPSFTGFSFRKPSTVIQQAIIGAVVDQLRIQFGGDVPTLDLSGNGLFVPDTGYFASLDATGKGALTTFPTEPSAPVTNGNMATGFLGSATLNGNGYGTMRNANLNLKFNRDVPYDQFNSYYGGQPGQDRREITGDFELYDDDSANLTALKNLGFSATGFTIIFVIGNIAGNIWGLTFNNCQITPVRYSDSQRKWSAKFAFKAHSTGLATKDSVVLALT